MPPVDVAAEVTSNNPLSAEYNVLALAAPAIAAAAAPGQFVMIKAGTGHDPLLRRPFSVFEVLRDARGDPTGISILNKRIGVATALVYDARPGQRIDCLGPLGRPFAPVDPPIDAWMVAGGVGLAPFAALAQVLRGRGVRSTLFYGARSGAELFYLDSFRDLGVAVVTTTEDGTAGERGRVTLPLERALAARAAGTVRTPVILYVCGPEPMMAAAAGLASRYDTPCFVSVERTMGCGLGGCYSCVVPMRAAHGGFHHVRSCIEGPVMAGDQIAWEQ
jgi:dihydroorotate dehydrogenase electron transfer subunit